jgi:mycothiol synthase
VQQTAFETLRNQGFSVRPMTMDDLEPYVDLVNASAQAMIGTDETTVEGYRLELISPKFNLATDTQIVLSPEGMLIACMEVWTTATPPVYPWVWGRVHPDWEGRGIGTALMQWAKDRALKVLLDVAEDIRVAMRASTVQTYEPAVQLLEGCGMNAIRRSWRMVMPLDLELQSPDWPEGITLREYHHPDDAQIFFNAEEEAFKDHWGFVDEPFEEGFKRWFHYATKRTDFDPKLWVMAMDDEEIAGVLRSRHEFEEDPEMGWISSLSVRRPWRGRGLGLALLQHAFLDLAKRGKARVGLGVDAGNLTGATRLYEKAGMQVDRTYATYEFELRPGKDISTQNHEA